MAIIGKQSVIQAPEHLGIHTREAFEEKAMAHLESLAESAAIMVIDLSQTEYVDTGGLATIAIIHSKAAELGHEVRLKGVNEEVQFALELAKLNTLVDGEAKGPS